MADIDIPPGSALGLVETHGLIAAVEAADAMLKAADVRLVRKHKVDPGMISHVVVGETSAVQAAVDAGVAAAQRVGRVYGSLVIPRPSDDVWTAMLGVRISTAAARPPAAAPPAAAPLAENAPADDASADGTEVDAAADASSDDGSSDDAAGAASGPPDGPVPATAPPDRDYDAMSVRTLRAVARERDDVTLRGRSVATASKDELVADLRAADAR